MIDNIKNTMLYISICLTLLVILLALFLLAKIKSEMLGSFYKWITWLVLIVAGTILVCQLARGVGRMMHRGKCDGKECASHGGHMKMKGHAGASMKMKGCEMGGKGANCPMMEQCGKNLSKEECAAMCEKMGIKDCCTGGMVDCPMHSGEMIHHESTTDTIDGKIIKKEIEIIEKKK
ncbi:MAG TPA: hypothetical protein PKD91_13330 [Bacteroidia bacterium]|nr:hypothetical protein [Bacteroidia bacterium]